MLPLQRLLARLNVIADIMSYEYSSCNKNYYDDVVTAAESVDVCVCVCVCVCVLVGGLSSW